MKHFAIYHSESKRGHVIQGEPGDGFAILTDRPAENALGAMVWLISGRGSPANYYVHFAFFATDCESGDDEGFRHRLFGGEGYRFDTPVRINHLPWFQDFSRSQGNFAFGLKEIKEAEPIAGLMELLDTAPCTHISVESPSYEPTYPDEVSVESSHAEGAIQRVAVNAYERDPTARLKCIDHYGCACLVCGFDFTDFYGELGAGFIHVHHRRPISECGGEYVVDPVEDLIPVCPNCHAMLHRGSSPPSVEELGQIYDENVTCKDTEE